MALLSRNNASSMLRYRNSNNKTAMTLDDEDRGSNRPDIYEHHRKMAII